jgi:hypothetical protein
LRSTYRRRLYKVLDEDFRIGNGDRCNRTSTTTP